MAGALLEITQNGSSRQVPVGAEPVTIGRQIANMVVIEDTEASRFHCVVEKVANGFRVRDLGSRNGTKVNGNLVKVALLDQDDVVTIGKTELRLVNGAKTPVKASSSAKPQAAMSMKPAQGSADVDDEVDGEGGLDFLAGDDYDPLAEPVMEDEVPGSGGAGPMIDQGGPPTD